MTSVNFVDNQLTSERNRNIRIAKIAWIYRTFVRFLYTKCTENWTQKKIKSKVNRSTLSVVFKETCIKERLLSKYTIYSRIYIRVSCVYLIARIYVCMSVSSTIDKLTWFYKWKLGHLILWFYCHELWFEWFNTMYSDISDGVKMCKSLKSLSRLGIHGQIKKTKNI